MICFCGLWMVHVEVVRSWGYKALRCSLPLHLLQWTPSLANIREATTGLRARKVVTRTKNKRRRGTRVESCEGEEKQKCYRRQSGYFFTFSPTLGTYSKKRRRQRNTGLSLNRSDLMINTFILRKVVIKSKSNLQKNTTLCKKFAYDTPCYNSYIMLYEWKRN